MRPPAVLVPLLLLLVSIPAGAAAENHRPDALISPQNLFQGQNIFQAGTVRFTGRDSYDVDGDAIVGYAWKLYRAIPDGPLLQETSGPLLAPPGAWSSPDVAFELTTGTYATTLVVTDAHGAQSTVARFDFIVA